MQYALDDKKPECEDESVWIADTADVMGHVILKKDSSVWFQSVVRGDTDPITIGAGTNIQDGCVLHADFGFPTTIGDGVTVGHKVILHGCTIADNCLIGMGATVLNGAKISKDSIVGAGALVTEGKEFPPESLIVGSPAKAIRKLSDAEKTMIQMSADIYQQNAIRFRSGLKQIT